MRQLAAVDSKHPFIQNWQVIRDASRPPGFAFARSWDDVANAAAKGK